jgi:hypothetical protein
METAIAQKTDKPGVWANIGGEVYGQVIVGNKNLQIGSMHGGVVNINYAGDQPRLLAKPIPLFVLPRRFAGLLDRAGEVQQASAALPMNRSMEIYGPDGIGKTSLLRYLARHSLTTSFPSGVVYLSASDQPAGDLLQSIFDFFYEYSATYKPSQGEMRQALQKVSALVILDEVSLLRVEVESLLDAAPESTFLLASADRRTWGEVESIPLNGLPLEDALALLSRELGRPLAEAEIPQAGALCQALNGYPLYLIQAAAMMRDQKRSLPDLLASLSGEEPGTDLASQALAVASRDEQRLLAAVASLGGAPLHERHIPALTKISDPKPVLQSLMQRGLIQAHSPKYTLAGCMPGALQEGGSLDAWREWALDYFQDWAESRVRETRQILEEAGGILHLVDWAVKAGRWGQALRLARAVESALALGGRWEAWEDVLQIVNQAAQATGDLGLKAWALHQIGTRALCLGQEQTALRSLIRAYRLRQSLGDGAGAAVTRHNLRLLLPPDGSSGDNPPKGPNGSGPKGGSLLRVPLLIAGAMILALGMVSAFSRFRDTLADTPTATPLPLIQEVTATPFPLETWTPSPGPVENTAAPVTPTDTPIEPTLPPSLTPTFTATAVPCVPKAGWPLYRIQRGDTLWSISQVTGTTVRRLQKANCLTGTKIIAGQSLRVPQLPPTPVPPTPIPPTNTPTYQVPASTESPVPTNLPPQVEILSPAKGDQYEFAGWDQAGWFVDLEVRGRANDPETGPLGDDFLAWSADPPGLLVGKGSAARIRLYSQRCRKTIFTVGLTATDPQGLPGSAVQQVVVNPSARCAPRIKIIEPRPGTYLYTDNDRGSNGFFKELVGAAYAEDASGRPLGDRYIRWSAIRPEYPAEIELGYGVKVKFTLTSPNYCPGVSYTIQVTAVDEDGNQASEAVNILISGNCQEGSSGGALFSGG